MNKKAIFVNTASQVAGKFASLVFALISIKLLTNYLGAKGIGEYNTITTFLNFFVVIADLGLFSVSVREISKNPEREKQILSNIFLIRLFSAIIATILAVLIVFFTKYDNNIKFGTLIASGFVLTNLLWSVYDVILQSRLKMQFSALAEFIGRLITIIALVLIINMQGNFYLIISTVSISGLLILTLKYLFAKRFVKFPITYDRRVANWIFNLAWPLGVIFIVNNIFFKVDTLILFVLKGATAVGIYTVAYKILEVILFVASYFASSLKPVLAQNISDKKEYLAKVIEKSFIVLLVIALPISLFTILFAKDIILFISNEEFVAGARALMIISLALPLMFLDILMAEILIANDERKAMIIISSSALALNLLLNFILIPRYSFLGAAAATVISELVLLIIYLKYTKRILPYKLDNNTLFKILLSLILVVIVYIATRRVPIHFLLHMTLLGLTYTLLLNFLSVAEFKSLKKILVNDQ